MTVDYKTRFEPLLSARARDRQVSDFYSFKTPDHIVAHPNPITLAGGTPDEGFFPVESIHLNLINEPFQHLSYSEKTANTNKFDINAKEQIHKINEQHASHTYRYSTNDEEIDIANGFQYAFGNGFPQLRKFASDLIKRAHKPGYNDWEVIFSNGSGDSLSKIGDLFVENGGTILVEEFTFTPFNTGVRDFKGTVVPVKLNIKGDEPGIDADYLDDLLTNWDKYQWAHLPKPKALYTIPTGQNPTGTSQSLKLRKKIYSIAEKHDFVIVEDDPYGYIVLPKYGTESPYEDENLSIDDYVKTLRPSYLTIDTTGRVVRLETVSKLFAPGLRLGFIVANPFFVQKFFQLTAVTMKTPSGPSQLIFNNVIQSWGGVDGWLRWATKIAKHYTRRTNLLLKTLYESESFKKGQFTVIEPDAGMFAIVYINIEKRFPDPKTWDKVLTELRYKTITNGVSVVFGNRMASDLSNSFTTEKSNFIRLTTAAAHTDELLVEATKDSPNQLLIFLKNLMQVHMINC